ncbi:DNA repair protein RecO [Arenibacter sp. F20364]|uniref:DNA repair protein RecO n=1 Tax=Arenibacter sp. F20364 TaxID=2926415 RepID=UPI001FF4C47F|nr:DNA repair protein RecO [Arenibacter sp. F20364]MCK0188680.1 DNA repair protein RecO [Arenibacter sp. F20364]
MQVATKGIVLTSIKYGDTSLIVRIFTFSDGIKSYLLRGILASKKGKLKTAYFQPLLQLDLIASHKNKGTLESITEAKVSYHYQSLHTDIAKNALTFFLAEMLSNSIHEEESNESLFNFIEAALQWLDTHDEFSNFHLYFLLSLTKYFGFYPDTKNMDLMYFDLLEGEFITSPSLNPIMEGDNLKHFKELLGINFDAIHSIKLNKRNRQELLKNLVLYYELHLQGFRKPKSLAVLNEVFS